LPARLISAKLSGQSVEIMELFLPVRRPFRAKKMNQNHAFWFTAKI
jgi:hypothetical protein